MALCSVTLHNAMRLYRTIDIQVDLGTQDQEYPFAGVDTGGALFKARRRLLGTVAQAQLTHSLKLTLAANVQRNRYEGSTESLGPDAIGSLPERDDRWTAE